MPVIRGDPTIQITPASRKIRERAAERRKEQAAKTRRVSFVGVKSPEVKEAILRRMAEKGEVITRGRGRARQAEIRGEMAADEPRQARLIREGYTAEITQAPGRYTPMTEGFRQKLATAQEEEEADYQRQVAGAVAQKAQERYYRPEYKEAIRREQAKEVWGRRFVTPLPTTTPFEFERKYTLTGKVSRGLTATSRALEKEYFEKRGKPGEEVWSLGRLQTRVEATAALGGAAITGFFGGMMSPVATGLAAARHPVLAYKGAVGFGGKVAASVATAGFYGGLVRPLGMGVRKKLEEEPISFLSRTAGQIYTFRTVTKGIAELRKPRVIGSTERIGIRAETRALPGDEQWTAFGARGTIKVTTKPIIGKAKMKSIYVRAKGYEYFSQPKLRSFELMEAKYHVAYTPTSIRLVTGRTAAITSLKKAQGGYTFYKTGVTKLKGIDDAFLVKGVGYIRKDPKLLGTIFPPQAASAIVGKTSKVGRALKETQLNILRQQTYKIYEAQSRQVTISGYLQKGATLTKYGARYGRELPPKAPPIVRKVLGEQKLFGFSPKTSFYTLKSPKISDVQVIKTVFKPRKYMPVPLAPRGKTILLPITERPIVTGKLLAGQAEAIVTSRIPAAKGLWAPIIAPISIQRDIQRQRAIVSPLTRQRVTVKQLTAPKQIQITEPEVISRTGTGVITSPVITPDVIMPTIVTPPFIQRPPISITTKNLFSFPEPGGGLRKTGYMFRPVKPPTQYQPSIYAAVAGIRAKKIPKAAYLGLIRPIVPKKKRRKKRKKR